MGEAVLILDDGELDDVAQVLSQENIPFVRLRGALIPSEIAPPLNLLVTTPRHAKTVRRGSPRNAESGRPLRVIVTAEDSGAMRRMLRRMGFDLLVRRPTHPETWRLLVQRALCLTRDEPHTTTERRATPRKKFSQTVAAEDSQGSRVLMGKNLSEGGMQIRRMPNMKLGETFMLAIYDSSQIEPMRVEATVVRDDGEHGFGLRFQTVAASTAARLEKLVSSLPDVECLEEGEAANLGAVIAELLPTPVPASA